jgi:predicted transcriptional regulator
MSETERYSAIAKLEKQAGLLQILVYLYEKTDKIMITELTTKIDASWETVGKTIKYLKNNELIDEEYTKTFPVQHNVWLTAKGRAVAKALVDAASELQHP